MENGYRDVVPNVGTLLVQVWIKEGTKIPDVEFLIPTQTDIANFTLSSTVIDQKAGLIVSPIDVILPYLDESVENSLNAIGHSRLTGVTAREQLVKLYFKTCGKEFDCRLIGATSIPEIKKLGSILRAEWKLGDGRPKKSHFGTWGLFQIREDYLRDFHAVVPDELPVEDPAKLSKGQKIVHISSPMSILSEEIFGQQISQSLITNFVGGTILADHRYLWGVEGGALLRPSGELVGIIWGPLRQKGNELNAITVAIPARTVENSMINAGLMISRSAKLSTVKLSQFSSLEDENQRVMMALEKNKSSILQISVNYLGHSTSRASGSIIRSDGLVLTNAHLFKTFVSDFNKKVSSASAELEKIDWDQELGPNITIEGIDFTGRSHRLRILAISNGNYDIAVLKIVTPTYSEEKFTPIKTNFKKLPKQGDRVISVAFPLYPVHPQIGPSITTGNITKVLKLEDKDLLYMTDCETHRGSSGGVILDEEGNFIALIFQNAKLSMDLFNKKDIYLSFVNMNIATSIFLPALLNNTFERHLWFFKDDKFEQFLRMRTDDCFPLFSKL